MSQRNSEYARKERDLYETPEWVTEALLPHLPSLSAIWEPACATGKMTGVFHEAGIDWYGTDIACADNSGYQMDFLTQTHSPSGYGELDAIITNPPYERATEFIEHALRLMEPINGLVAMLLRTDFDHAKSRAHLFRDCPAFAKKLVLMKRIVWFAEDNGRPKASPSFNHAWYLWNWKHEGAPTIAYGP